MSISRLVRQHKWQLLLGLLIYAAMLWQNMPVPWLQVLYQRLSFMHYDVRLSTTLQPEKITLDASPVAIIDIDDRSLQEVGRWPWPRQTIATLVEKLFQQGVLVVGFDVQFSEPEWNAVARFLQQPDVSDLMDAEQTLALQQLAEQLEGDHFLAQSFALGDVVLGYSFNDHDFAPAGELPAPIAVLTPQQRQASLLRQHSSYSANIAALQQQALGAGFINAEFDPDGILRRTPLIIQYQGQIFGSLALNMANAYFLGDQVQIQTEPQGLNQAVTFIQLSNLKIATDASGNVLIPFKGPPFSLPYVSAADVLLRADTLPDLAQKAVIIGTSATALADLKSTPVHHSFPGVEIHGTVLYQLLKAMEGQQEGNVVVASFPTEPDWSQGAIFLLLSVMIVLVVAFPLMGPMSLILSAVVTMVGLNWLDYYLYTERELALDMSRPMLLLFLITLTNLAYGFILQTRKRIQIKNMFGQYVPPAYVDQLMHAEQLLSLDGESRNMTVLFADIRSFTTISESLSATRLKQLLNTFFDPMTAIIFNNHGTIDKYVGDMIMAFWGAPLVDGHHADHAIASALKMLEKVDQMQDELQAQGFPEVRIGVGLNTGMMNVGDMGSKFRRAYTVLGDSVNLGSRLEGLTKFYGVSLLIGEETYAQQTRFLCRRLDRVKVKGKDQAIQVYQPLCEKQNASRDMALEIEQHHQALDYYLAQRWGLAQQLFSQLRKAHPNVYIYELYLNRIMQLQQQTLPADWDGVYVRTEK